MTRILKALVLFTFIGFFLFTGSCLRLLLRTESIWRPVNFWFCQFYSRIALYILAIDLRTVTHSMSGGDQRGKLYLCNHMSYLDIMVISAWLRCCFVTSVEIRDTFFLGHLCRIAGCIFVERRSRAGIDTEIDQIAQALRNGISVLIFPEGTSSNGDAVLPFKRSLLKVAILAEADVHPLCLQYLAGDGMPLTTAERDNVCWYGSVRFLPHLWALLEMKTVRAKLHFLPAIRYTSELTRDQIADQAHATISSTYVSAKPIPTASSDFNRSAKLIPA